MSTKEANNLLTRAKTWVTSISTEKQEMFLKLFILTSAAILGVCIFVSASNFFLLFHNKFLL
jgi:hypothetical protein